MSDVFLELNHIKKKYGAFTALDDISLQVKKGEFICLLGPSGCGKTTLLRIIAGLEKPTCGQVLINGRDATGLPPGKRNFGIVFQSYALFPNMTVRQNIAFGLKKKHLDRAQTEERIIENLKLVNLADQIDKYPGQLSGGQQQRVALARALVLFPDFLLLDEPLSALDAKVRQKVRQEIRELQQKLGITTIMVTHDQEEALTMADRIVVMNNACIMQEGTPVEVYEKPQNAFVADFIGSINFFRNNLMETANMTTDMQLAETMSASGNVMKACRPENIEIVECRSLNSFNVRVARIEFRGSCYRLWLDPHTETDMSLYSDHISFDLSPDLFIRRGIQVGDQISIRFKRGKVYLFDEAAS